RPLRADARHAWHAHCSWRPAQLFSGVNRAMTTVISTQSTGRKGRTWSTTYQKWRTSERALLTQRIAYVEIPRQRSSFWVPKLGADVERGLLAKLLAVPTGVRDFLASPRPSLFPEENGVRPGGSQPVPGTHIYYRTDGGLYWKVFTDFPPAFTVEGRAGHSTRETWLTVAHPAAVAPLIAALSSDVFWW